MFYVLFLFEDLKINIGVTQSKCICLNNQKLWLCLASLSAGMSTWHYAAQKSFLFLSTPSGRSLLRRCSLGSSRNIRDELKERLRRRLLWPRPLIVSRFSFCRHEYLTLRSSKEFLILIYPLWPRPCENEAPKSIEPEIKKRSQGKMTYRVHIISKVTWKEMRFNYHKSL